MQNGIPVGLRSSPSFGLSRSGQLTAIIQSLFWDGSQGWWYDDNDTTTLFQDSAGTTPVTAVEQFVGLQLDKSKGLVLGPELVPATYSGVVGGLWAISATAVTRNGSSTNQASFNLTSPPTANKHYQVVFTVSDLSGDTLGFRLAGGTAYNITANGTYTFRIISGSTGGLTFIPWAGTAGQATITNISIRELPGNHRYAPASGNRPIWSKRVNLLTKTEQINDAVWVKNGTATTPSANTLNLPAVNDYIYQSGVPSAGAQMTLSAILSGTGTVSLVAYDNVAGFQISNVTLTATPTQYSFTFTFGAGASDRRAGIGRLTSTTATSVTVNGADLRPANQATGLLPLYQRVNTSTDYDTNGFPGYLKADGVDDFLQTNSIDFSAGPTNPPLGPELVVNGDGTTLTGWTSVNDASCTTAVSGGQFVLTTVAGGGARLRQTIPVTAGRAYRITGFVQANNNSAAGALQVWGTGYGSGDLYASAQVVNGTVSATVTATSANLYLQLNAFNSSSGITNYYDNISVKEITNANLGADKITLCAGVRKLSDAAESEIVEFSANAGSNNGTMVLYTLPAAVKFSYASKGTILRTAEELNSAYNAPVTAVLSGVSNISGDSVVLRINGAQVASNTADQGTGNYGNYPVYFFQRNGPPAANRFNGYEYGNIAVGKLLTADQLTALETYMNGLTKAY